MVDNGLERRRPRLHECEARKNDNHSTISALSSPCDDVAGGTPAFQSRIPRPRKRDRSLRRIDRSAYPVTRDSALHKDLDLRSAEFHRRRETETFGRDLSVLSRRSS